MTLLVVERYVVADRAVESFREQAAALVETMRAAPGFLWAHALHALDDPGLVTICAEWRTAGDCDAFVAAAEYAAFREAADAVVVEDPSARRFVPAGR